MRGDRHARRPVDPQAVDLGRGKPILEHTIGILNAAPDIDEIVVMMAPGQSLPLLPFEDPGFRPSFVTFRSMSRGGQSSVSRSRPDSDSKRSRCSVQAHAIGVVASVPL